MKIFITFLFLLVPILSISQSYEIFKKDTINFTTPQGLKQGLWIFFITEQKTKLSEGKYKDGLKQGLWTEYDSLGNKKATITYIDNRKNGYAKIYYPNGNIKEEGIWQQNKWTGQYKYYYDNGTPYCVWNYDSEGQRTGKQTYFHRNGKIKIEGQWAQGKETGDIKEYTSEGTLIAEKKFDNGVFDAANSRNYTASSDNSVIIQSEDISAGTNENNKISNDVGVFSGDGFHKFYNASKKIEREGEFRGGFLYSGKHYIYNKSGELIKTEIFEEGKISQIILKN